MILNKKKALEIATEWYKGGSPLHEFMGACTADHNMCPTLPSIKMAEGAIDEINRSINWLDGRLSEAPTAKECREHTRDRDRLDALRHYIGGLARAQYGHEWTEHTTEPTCEYYGAAKTKTGADAIRINLSGITLWFSYGTLVAFDTPRTGTVIAKNAWTASTGGHIDQIARTEGDRVKQRDVDPDRFADLTRHLQISLHHGGAMSRKEGE